MKRAILAVVCVLIGAVLAVVWMRTHGKGGAAAGGEKPAEKAADDEAGPTVETDTNGHVVININDELQGEIGIKVAGVKPESFSPEFKGYGRVLDPAPLAALMTELATDQAAYAASSNELVRLKTLAAENNASARALQAADATAQHDQLAIQSAKDRLRLAWGPALSAREDFPNLMQSLTSLSNAVVRIDLPAGEKLDPPPTGARIVTLAGSTAEADFLGPVVNVDPQTQGQGFNFLVKSDSLRLLPNEAVTGYIKVAGEAIPGVIIPREAIIRTDGASWVYVLSKSSEAFTRLPVNLEHPAEGGWFVTNGIAAKDYVVVTGAQTLLSQEMKGQMKAD
ncbi:MAG TPA: hypothetical protein VN281_09410 [Verrucomicrobiae bacterium]|nr:hypothetical protein [Verrucomicrobiae bacterium]